MRSLEESREKDKMFANGYISDYRRVTEDPDKEFKPTKLKSRILINSMLEKY